MASDHLLVLVIVVISPLADLWWYPRFARATAAGSTTARPVFYASAILLQWTLAGSVVALWIYHGRDWRDLKLGITTSLQFAAGVVLTAAYLTLLGIQRRRILARPDRVAMIRRMLGSGAPIIPRTATDCTAFLVLSITAGVCEELLYRGYLLWYGQLWTNFVIAFVATCIAFGFAHCYLGAKHICRTATTGGIFGLIVLASGSLWPAMIIHAATDILAGDLGFRAFGDPGPEAELGTEPSAADDLGCRTNHSASATGPS